MCNCILVIPSLHILSRLFLKVLYFVNLFYNFSSDFIYSQFNTTSVEKANNFVSNLKVTILGI